jgi:GTP cyclohydrolase I/GTP cyclohydrolase-4
MSRQENLETIHQHNVVAEHYGLVEELALELRTGRPAPRRTTKRAWLEGAAPSEMPG